MVEATLNATEQDYLKALYHHLRRGDSVPVGTVALAARLGVSPALITGMAKRLAARGLVAYSPYHGATLTPDGERVALHVLRQHRLLETFLSERLGMPWDKVHAEADRLEHALSATLEERIDTVLGHPTTDPHGAPIPTKDGRIRASATTPLWQALPGTLVEVAEVEDEDAQLLTYLAELGLRPGAPVAVLTMERFGGPLRVRVAGREHALGEVVARAVLVAPAAPAGTAGGEAPDGAETRPTNVRRSAQSITGRGNTDGA